MLRRWFDYTTIKRSGYFDPAYYLLNCPDCQLEDMDPLSHFVEHGWKAGRNPSSKFDTKFYLKMYPDVKRTGINPLVHYLKHGRQEGRLALPDQAPESVRMTGSSRQKGGLLDKLYNLGKNIYWRISPRFRQKVLFWSYRNLGFLFKALPNYRNWRKSQELVQTNAWYPHNLIDINSVEPARNADGSIAIHIHIFYHDLAKEFVKYLKNMPFHYDLYVSISNQEDLDTYRRLFSGLPFCGTVKIKRVLNRGRDSAPMFCTFSDELAGHDFIAHLHTKKSVYNKGATEGWREYLCNNLFGSEDRIRRIFSLLGGKDPCGIVYPQNYIFLPYWANTWLANRGLGQDWCSRLGIGDVPRGYFDYPASSMFWARSNALAPLFTAGITLNDFPEETGQTDGTLAHCLERLLVLCSLKQELPPGIIRDVTYPSWSAWRLDQYTNRSVQDVDRMLTSPDIKLIAFDIFDTLLCRPLLDPEMIKTIVSRWVGGDAGLLFKEYRPTAEGQARSVKGSDVGLNEIYSQLGKLAGLPEESLAELKRVEAEVEEGSLEPRWEAVDLYKRALDTGKPVALISDMFLPRDLIEQILGKFGITGWDALFLSNEIGLRKDNAALYKHVFEHYAIEPTEMLMVGDNERSDVQIPCDMGASFLHLLKPLELARGLPRFSNLIVDHEHRGNCDAELTLGLVVRKNFAPIHYQNFDHTSLVEVTPYNWGYSLVGPLLVSFAYWLLQKARTDKVQRLYFLSREGRIIKDVYDCWCEGEENFPGSDYLVASRRATGVAAISTLEDILEIARTVYYPNTLENFLITRYGLSLSDEQWEECARSFKMGRSALITVQNRQVRFLLPLLQALEPQIVARAENEKAAFLRYLADKGMGRGVSQAVVDIGYGGSVQGYLNRLLSHKVHGYYMMTDERSIKIARTHQVHLRGCFVENSSQSADAPVIYRDSFDLERLLSSNEPQVEYYELNGAGNLDTHFRPLSPVEQECAWIRNELQQGTMAYARDARQLRRKMLPDFQPSCWTAQMLMDAFLVQHSQGEKSLLSKIVLDDHYCGRDLVS